MTNRGHPTAAGRIEDSALAGLLSWAERERLTPLLCSFALKALELRDEQRALLTATLHQSAVSSLKLEAAAKFATSLLADAGIDYRYLKGAATSQVLYEASVNRQLGDIDLLVKPASFDRATKLLETSGLSIMDEPPFGRVTGDSRKATTFRSADGTEIDLHRRLSSEVGGYRIDATIAFDHSADYPDVGDAQYLPSLELLMTHACIHMLSRGTRLSTLADIFRITCHPNLDCRSLAELSRETGCDGVVGWVIVDVGIRSEQATAILRLLGEGSGFRRRVGIARYYSQHQRFGAWVSYCRHAGLRSPIAAAEMAFPSRDFLDAKQRSRMSHLLRFKRASSRLDLPVKVGQSDLDSLLGRC